MRKLMYITLAAVASPFVGAVDLQTAYEDAVRNDPVFAVAMISNKISKEGFPIAISTILPQITFSAGRGESEFSRSVDRPPGEGFPPISEGKSENERWSVSASQTLFDTGAWITLLSARVRLQAANETLREAEQNLVVRVAQAYLNVLRGQDLLDSRLAAEEAVERQLEQAQQRFDVGLVAITDVLNTTAAYDNAKVTTIDAKQSHGIFFESLGTITGVNYDEINRLTEDLPITQPDPVDEEAWVQEALANNPNLIIAEKNLVAAKHDRRRVWTTYSPRLTISGTKSFNRDPTSFLGEETTSQSLSLGVNIPIFQGGRVLSQHRSAAYSVEQAKQNVVLQRVTIARDTRNLYRAVVTDVIRVNAKKKAIESNQAALEATQTGYEVGTRNVVDVLLAQQQLYGAIFDHADSRYTYVLNGLRLKQSAGTLTGEDVIRLNQFVTSVEPVSKIMSLSGQ